MPDYAKEFKGLNCNFNGKWNIENWKCPVTVGTMRLDATKSKEKDLFVFSCFTFPVHIKMLNCEFSTEALLDPRASTYFMDKDFAMKHSLELIGKIHPIPVKVIDGRPLASGNVMQETQLLEVRLEDQLSHIVFNIIQYPTNLVVLNLPWFELHNLDVNWNIYVQQRRI